MGSIRTSFTEPSPPRHPPTHTHTSTMSLRLVYWNVRARGWAPMLIAAAGGLDMKLDDATANTWPAPKDQMPFGQLPVLYDGDLKIAQSMAIVNYLSRKAKLEGSNDAEFARSQMLAMESNDLWNDAVKAQYAGDDAAKKAAWDALFKADGPLQQQLELLEKNFFNKPAPLTGGEIALFAVLNMLKELEPTLLDSRPAVKAWYEGLAKHEKLAPLLASPPPSYLKRA